MVAKNSNLITWVMGFVTGAAVVAAAKKCTVPASSLGTVSDEVVEEVEKSQRGISMADFSAIMKRLASLKDKVSAIFSKSDEIPVEKERMLNATVKRIDALEEEMNATKKALEDSLERQKEVLDYVEKKKNKKCKFLSRK